MPCTFDDRMALLASLDALVAVAAEVIDLVDGQVVARTRTDFSGEGGVGVGTVVAITRLARDHRTLRCRVQIADTRVQLEVGERLSSGVERQVTVVDLHGDVVMLSAVTMDTSRGRSLTAVTTTVLVGATSNRRPRGLKIVACTSVSSTTVRVRKG
jgi:hypothetical protein